MKTLKEMLAEARQIIPEQPPAELKKRLDAGEPVVVIDVRDPDEYRDGSIEAANNISRGFLEFRIGSVASDPSTPLVLYCQTGLRSMLAAKALHDLGYKNVINLQGGFQRWAQSGLPVVKDTPLTSEQIQRYSRHFLLPQVGEKGQRKLLRSKVLLIGAGGLARPRRSIWRPPASAPWGSWTATSWTSPTFSVRSSTPRPASDGRRSTPARRLCWR